VSDTTAEGTRKIGSSELRWEDGVEARNWKNAVMNREDWLKPLKRPGFTQDCRANDYAD
jgi:hypothetical protein